MLTSLKKYSTIIASLLLLLLFVVAWFNPALGLVLGTIVLVLSLVMACIAVVQRHRKSYLEAEITYFIFMRNVALEISGILLAAACAVFLGNYIALVATQSIGDMLIRFAVGVFVGLLIGIAIGAMVRKFWNRFLLQQMK